MSIPPILLVGCGRMGGAMLAGWREQGLAASVAVDPAPEAARQAGVDLTVVADAGGGSGQLPAGRGGIRGEAPERGGDVAPVSALGRKVGVLVDHGWSDDWWDPQSLLGDAAAIVRAMPNTPAAVRQGVTVACPGTGVDTPQRVLCERLLQAIGVVAWVEDEGLLDPVTAVSGSGPAYVFLLAELMERAAIEQGIPADLARLLARQTVSGSGALLAASAEDAAELRRAVTSPGGTTERALSVLMAGEAWPAALSRAIAAATERSRQLAG